VINESLEHERQGICISSMTDRVCVCYIFALEVLVCLTVNSFIFIFTADKSYTDVLKDQKFSVSRCYLVSL